ncbi:hypothetical protein HA402_008221 [Bradysia odoriphaga]|nr:hypothetical protein HA402_008221 [Bradysia odoriphaga]
MNESEVIYNLLFALITYCIIYPPLEFIEIGLTVDKLLKNLLGNEELEFIQYHQRRCAITLVVHCFIPFTYTALYFLNFDNVWVDDEDNPIKYMMWNSFFTTSLAMPLVGLCVAFYWCINDCSNHPITKTLRKYCNNDNNWHSVATSVNDEYRRDTKNISRTSSIATVIATENWILKCTPYRLHIAHQSDTALIAVKSDTHPIAQDTSDFVQYVNILVKPTRTGVKEFSIRINALDFKHLQDRIDRPITILAGVNFNRSVIDRFIEVFRAQIALNPVYRTEQISDVCFACMLVEPNIKIQKQCLDVDENGVVVPNSSSCENCYCTPMWCVDCMAKWFASRQNQHEKEVWLQQKCTCPMCRAPFCILDVCFVERQNVR